MKEPAPAALEGGRPAGALVERLGRVVGALVQAARAASALGILASLVLVCYAVVARYVFAAAPTWVDDAVGFVLVGVVMCAAASTLREGEHIAVDILTSRLGPRARRWAEAWSMLAVAAISAMLVVNGWETAMSSRMLGIMTSDHLELPIWTLQLLLPFGGATMLVVAAEALLRLALGLPRAHGGPA